MNFVSRRESKFAAIALLIGCLVFAICLIGRLMQGQDMRYDRNGECEANRSYELRPLGAVKSSLGCKVLQPFDFYGVTLGAASASTNGFERRVISEWRVYDSATNHHRGGCRNVTNHYNRSYWVWHMPFEGDGKAMRPADCFDFVEVEYSYKTKVAARASFYAHFPAGMTRKECISILDSIADDVKAKYGAELKEKDAEQNAEEPTDFVQKEIPVSLLGSRNRYAWFRKDMFYSRSFEGEQYEVSIVAGESIFGERCAILSASSCISHELLDEGITDFK